MCMKTLYFPLLLVVVNAFQTTKPFRPLHYESRVSIAEGIPNRCLLRRAAIDDNDDDTFDLAASESSSSSSSDDDPPITDLYGELGLKRRASSKEITTAFRKLALQWHPDRNRGGGRRRRRPPSSCGCLTPTRFYRTPTHARTTIGAAARG